MRTYYFPNTSKNKVTSVLDILHKVWLKQFCTSSKIILFKKKNYFQQKCLLTYLVVIYGTLKPQKKEGLPFPLVFTCFIKIYIMGYILFVYR